MMSPFNLLLLAFAVGSRAATHQMIVGTFSASVLHTLEFDDQAQTLQIIANTTAPAPSSWIALNASHDQSRLYGVGVLNDEGGLLIYSIKSPNEIVYTGFVPAGGDCFGPPDFVVAHPQPPFAVYAAFPTFGSATSGCGAVVSVDENGQLDQAIQNYTYLLGSAVQEMELSSDSKYLYSADDSGNSIERHAVNSTTGEVSQMWNMSVPVDGADPCHIAMHFGGQYMYVVMEGTSQIIQYLLDDIGIPTMDNTTFSLLHFTDDQSQYWADEVALSATNSYLLATSRARDPASNGTISVFTLDVYGKIDKQDFLLSTTTSGGLSNSVAPSPLSDRIVALVDNTINFVEIWELSSDDSTAQPIARVDVPSEGCCANAVWLN
ncbi:Lactonase, 7-bladed beta-propeller-domain-containing protein [Xylariaceae sp. FL0255]|nr:Lactonase, 7-bladed beta-propeller-domain-containing protein [Xylariaceae sp. FL0255]